MCDDWMPAIRLPISLDEFHQLPRNPAYRYEYFRDHALLTPRPKHYHALLPLEARSVNAEVSVRQARSQDFSDLVPLFAGAFATIQPFGSLDETTRKEAAQQALERTRDGGDGPWIEAASFVARENKKPIGALLITLLPEGDPCHWDSYRWQQPPPPDCIARRLGRPHLTWIFVSPRSAGRGVGTTLLAASVNQLLELGFHELLSTFMVGNDSSMLWHWRNGFRLLAHPASRLKYLPL
jgi:GNAT superfamily N-acetyltransferase